MKITKKTAIGVTLIVLIGLTSWGLADTLTEQHYIDAGKAEFPKGNYETALYLFTAGLQLNPDNPGLYNDRGLCYLKEGDIEEAIADLSKAIELNPDFTEAYYNRGLAYYEKGKQNRTDPNDKAIADFSKAIELDPNFVDAYYQRGLTYSGIGHSGIHHYHKLPAEPWPTDMEDRYNRALADFNKVLELDPNYVLAHAGLGNLFYKYYDSYEEMQKAIAEYDKALESEELIVQKAGNKGLREVYYSRGRAYTHMGEWEKSESDYLKGTGSHLTHLYWDWKKCSELIAFANATGRTKPSIARGMCYAELKQYDKAISDLENSSIYKGHGVLWGPRGKRCLAEIYRERGDEDKARAVLEEAINMSNKRIASRGSFTAYCERGLTYLDLKEYDKAISDLLKVIDEKAASDREYGHSNYYVDAHIGVVKAYLENGEKEKAREYFEKVVELLQRPGTPRRTSVIKELQRPGIPQ
jgi:tetratricopeptide (TPR) repeat protein